jgi:multiple sugar transport system substrate-binding protein
MRSGFDFSRLALLWVTGLSAALSTGCPSGTNSPAAKSAPAKLAPLVLLVVDDPKLGQTIAREWLGRTEEQLTVHDVSLKEILSATRLPGDAIIFPCGMIGHFAERGLIVPLEGAALEDSDFNYRDIFDQIRLREMRWGAKTLATPLGSPQLLLAYRPDIFANAGLEPPADWPAYQRAVQQFTDRSALGDLAPPDDQPWRATIEPLAKSWAGQTLLARAAAYAMHREQISPLFRFDSMAPLIDQPPYIRALEELIAAAKAGGFHDQHATPEQAWLELARGHCAMAVTWAMPLEATERAANKGQIAFAVLPGSSQAYRFATKNWEHRGEDDSSHVPVLAISGRMAGVSSSSSDPRRAEGFVVWLAGREVSQHISPASQATTLFRNSHVANSSRWTGSLPAEASRQYGEIVAETLSVPRAFPGVTLPGRLDYLAALDEAVDQAVGGELSAKEALQKAAARWREITDQLDTGKQRRASARSLGQGDG